MKTGLDHLPAGKRRELDLVKAVLMEEFDKALVGATQPWRREGKIQKIILFGSFSRRDWVDEPQNGYQSDWDLLIVVSQSASLRAAAKQPSLMLFIRAQRFMLLAPGRALSSRNRLDRVAGARDDGGARAKRPGSLFWKPGLLANPIRT